MCDVIHEKVVKGTQCMLNVNFRSIRPTFNWNIHAGTWRHSEQTLLVIFILLELDADSQMYFCFLSTCKWYVGIRLFMSVFKVQTVSFCIDLSRIAAIYCRLEHPPNEENEETDSYFT